MLLGEHKSIAEAMESILYTAQDLGCRVLEPTLVKGVLSIASGKIISTEDLAEKLKVNADLLDVCILLARFSRGDGKIKKCIDGLKASNSFAAFCKHLSFDMNVFIQILQLVFNQIDSKNIPDVFNTLGLQDYCHIGILRGIMAICKGYIHRGIYDSHGYELATKIREEDIAEL